MGLFTPAWNSKNYEKALKAVEKITDEKKLQKIAIKAINEDIRIAAIDKITDQNALIEIAKTDNVITIKIAAIKNFDSKNLQLIPEIVEQIISSRTIYTETEVRDFIQFAYKISQQEQKQKLQKYDGKVFSNHYDSPHSDIGHNDYTDYYGDGGGHNDHSDSPHSDRPEIAIHF